MDQSSITSSFTEQKYNLYGSTESKSKGADNWISKMAWINKVLEVQNYKIKYNFSR